MKTKVDGLLIRDDFGVQRRVSSRCSNGDFKRKYIRNLIAQGLLQPTSGVVTLLGELIDENASLRRQLLTAIHDKQDAEDTIDSIAERIFDYYDETDGRY